MITRMWQGEPALVLGVVQAVLAATVTFGLELSDEQLAALVAVIAAVHAVAVRRNVEPHRKASLARNDSVVAG